MLINLKPEDPNRQIEIMDMFFKQNVVESLQPE